MDVQVTLGKPIGELDPRIYGQFIEHILTCIEGGIYDPGSPLSREDGIRADVVEKLKEMSPPILRFPGGTITCQYHWEDAVGPKENRIRRKNLIWGGELDPSFGTAEFVSLCREIGAEPMICVNMASGTPEEAGNWVEYCNGTGNTYYANLRRSHGFSEPFNVKYWCIGNECYAGPDIGTQNDVNIYIRDAFEFIKFMKLTDKSIKTVIVACDDEHWNRSVLDTLHPVTDYFSYHHYSAENGNGLYGPYIGEKSLKDTIGKLTRLLDEYPEQVTDFNPWYRFPPRSGKIRLSIDEWNIWEFRNDETYGLLMRYNWRDALWTASILNLFLANPAVKIANLAQSVNVMAPIITEKECSWYQTIAHPLLEHRNKMLGTGLEVNFISPVISDPVAGEILAISISAVSTLDNKICLCAVNRDFHDDHALILPCSGGKVTVLAGGSPDATCSSTENCVIKEQLTFTGSRVVLPAGSISYIEF